MDHFSVPTEKTTTNLCGIYVITNQHTKEVYVGSSTSLHNRLKTHIYDLSRNRHHTPALQQAWNEHGTTAFSFQIVELCSPDDIEVKEGEWICKLNAQHSGYNRKSVASMYPRSNLNVKTEIRARLTKMGFKSYNEALEHLLDLAGH